MQHLFTEESSDSNDSLFTGIGVDDMFVVVQAWNNLPPDLIEQRGVPEAIGLTLKHAVSALSLFPFFFFCKQLYVVQLNLYNDVNSTCAVIGRYP